MRSSPRAAQPEATPFVGRTARARWYISCASTQRLAWLSALPRLVYACDAISGLSNAIAAAASARNARLSRRLAAVRLLHRTLIAGGVTSVCEDRGSQVQPRFRILA